MRLRVRLLDKKKKHHPLHHQLLDQICTLLGINIYSTPQIPSFVSSRTLSINTRTNWKFLAFALFRGFASCSLERESHPVSGILCYISSESLEREVGCEGGFAECLHDMSRDSGKPATQGCCRLSAPQPRKIVLSTAEYGTRSVNPHLSIPHGFLNGFPAI